MSEQQRSDTRKSSPGKDYQKPKTPKFSFNFYWIYAILIAVIFIVQFMDFGNKPKEINWMQFETGMLKTHEVEKLEVVNKEKVNVYIKKDKLSSQINMF